MGTNIDMDMFDITFFRTSIVALFIASLFDKPRRDIPREIRFGMASLLCLVFINIFIHAFTPTGLHNSMNLFLAVSGIAIIYTHYDDTKSIKKYVLVAAAINFIFYIMQNMGFDPVWTIHPYGSKETGSFFGSWKGQEGAFLGNEPRLITYFALVTPFLTFPFLALGAILGVITKQFVIFIPIMIMLFSRIKEKRARILLAVGIALILFLIKGHIFSSLGYRFNLAWAPALKAFFKQPLIGIGLGERVFPEIAVVGNSYLQFIIGVGVMGAAWLWYIGRETWYKLKNNNECIALISLAMIACIEYPVETPRLWILIMGIITMYLLKTYVGEKAHD
jgi:hypothetical protein